jgi:phage-related minor tail protein
MVLAESGNVANKIFTPLNLVIAATGIALFGLARAMSAGSTEFAHFNNELSLTGNYAGVTAARLKEMTTVLAGETNTRVSAATEVFNKLVLSGKFTGETLRNIAGASLELSRRTGEDADKFAQDFTRMSSGVYKFAQDFTSQYHLLDAAQVEYIRQLELAGHKEEAERALSEAVYNGIRRTGVAQLGTLERAWLNLGHVIDGITNA